MISMTTLLPFPSLQRWSQVVLDELLSPAKRTRSSPVVSSPQTQRTDANVAAASEATSRPLAALNGTRLLQFRSSFESRSEARPLAAIGPCRSASRRKTLSLEWTRPSTSHAVTRSVPARLGSAGAPARAKPLGILRRRWLVLRRLLSFSALPRATHPRSGGSSQQPTPRRMRLYPVHRIALLKQLPSPPVARQARRRASRRPAVPALVLLAPALELAGTPPPPSSKRPGAPVDVLHGVPVWPAAQVWRSHQVLPRKSITLRWRCSRKQQLLAVLLAPQRPMHQWCLRSRRLLDLPLPPQRPGLEQTQAAQTSH
mmetsp:Transcript_18171/g.40086  ORF Transcript_18171/g.40086 Transcript_18171/m.40086 type:complete len:314 (+) Transcript_18171:806-1747(+)